MNSSGYRRLGVLLLLGSAGCDKDVEPLWRQFNASGESVTVQVGAAEELEAVFVDLYSSSGEVLVGVGSVNPGGGPVGTRHVVKVEVFNDYEGQVDKATVRTDSGPRGIDEYRLKTDSADEGIYTLDMDSVGDEGESRQDLFTFRLWHDVNDADTGSDD